MTPDACQGSVSVARVFWLLPSSNNRGVSAWIAPVLAGIVADALYREMQTVDVCAQVWVEQGECRPEGDSDASR